MYPRQYSYGIPGSHMPYCPGAPMGHMPHHERLTRVIQDCEAVCEHMTHLIKMMPDVHMRAMQLELLRDCADICGLTVKYVARLSHFAKAAAGLCGTICEACAMECAKFPDLQSQHCAQVCLNCARECEAFAMM